jgi:maleylacetate reductase
MLSFIYDILPSRVIFGAGSLDRLPEEIERLGAKRALVLSTPEQREQGADLAHRLGARAVGLFDRAVMHVPIEIAQAAREEAARLGADCCVSIGGGSTTGLAKAIALVSSLPILSVPTTYAGSEMTPIWGLTEGGVKKTGRDPRVLPKTVLYDPALTLSIPPQLTATSAMNAVAHCVEALYAKDANPVVSMIAEEGIRAFARSLPHVMKDPSHIDARADALYGAWLGGISLGAVGMALHHKLCHTLGGTFNLPHAETHTVLLPHAAAYNAAAAPEAMGRIARGLAVLSAAPAAAAQGLYDLAASLGAPVSLESLGLKHEDLVKAADLAVQNPYYNPRPVTREGVLALLEDAFAGRRPN